MTQELVEMLLRSLQGSSVSEIEYEASGQRIRLVRQLAVTRTIATETNAKSSVSAAANPAVDAAELKARYICAAMHGTFYRATAPGELPLTEAGQKVEVGQQVAVLEAMKMMHPIEADTGGTIIRVLVNDLCAVEPGTPLFEIENSGDQDV